jgi:carboxyl-terminal processing protease
LGRKRSWRCWACTAALLLCVTLPALGAEWNGAAGPGPLSQLSVQELSDQAAQAESIKEWSSASELWYQVLLRDRTNTGVRERYRFCLRRAQQVNRFHDESYRQQIVSLSLDAAIQVYGEVLAKLHTDYVDQDKVRLPLLFKHGLEELQFALEEAFFCQTFAQELPSDVVRAFGQELQNWAKKSVKRPADAQGIARDIALAAQKSLGLKPSLVVLELACGACVGLDECTYYLTPGQFNELNASLKGEAVGIGAEVVKPEQDLIVSYVIPRSPASQMLKKGDRILRIGNRQASTMTAEEAADLLKGAPDTTVELEVRGLDAKSHVYKLRRQVVRLPSVSTPGFLPDPVRPTSMPDPDQRIGYLQLFAFQENTIDELNEAIAKLQADGMRALVLDLRGNPGGLFDVARQVVERFVATGVIVSTQGRVAGEFNTTYHAHGTSVLDVPLVVLVDGETASSAEMVAGALKDHLRGRLVGKTTFGKGSIQKVRPLHSMPAGIRMTVARFYSPNHQSYDEQGVAPQLEVDRVNRNMELDSQVQAAAEIARSLLMRPMSAGGID